MNEKKESKQEFRSVKQYNIVIKHLGSRIRLTEHAWANYLKLSVYQFPYL